MPSSAEVWEEYGDEEFEDPRQPERDPEPSPAEARYDDALRREWRAQGQSNGLRPLADNHVFADGASLDSGPRCPLPVLREVAPTEKSHGVTQWAPGAAGSGPADSSSEANMRKFTAGLNRGSGQPDGDCPVTSHQRH